MSDNVRCPNCSILDGQIERLYAILTHIASHGIHTDKLDAQITMGLEDQHKDLIEVLDREIQRSKPQQKEA